MSGALPPRIAGTVGAVSSALSAAGIRHEIGGSVLAALLGMRLVPGDVDVVVGPDDRREVADALGWPATGPPPASPVWRSAWIDRYRGPGCPVDVVGGPALWTGDRVVPLPMGGGTTAVVGGVSVPLADPAVWLVVYRLLRPERAIGLAALAGGDAEARADRLIR